MIALVSVQRQEWEPTDGQKCRHIKYLDGSIVRRLTKTTNGRGRDQTDTMSVSLKKKNPQTEWNGKPSVIVLSMALPSNLRSHAFMNLYKGSPTKQKKILVSFCNEMCHIQEPPSLYLSFQMLF